MSKIFKHLVRLIVFTILSTLLVSMAFSQSVPGMSTIYGHVNVNGKSQSGVIVYGGAGETSTDSSGNYQLNAVNNSKTTVRALYDNVSTKTDVFVASASQKVPDMNIAVPTPTPTVTITPTPSPNATATATPTPSPTASISPTPTPSPSASVSPTPSPSASASVSPTPTTSITPTPSVTLTPTPTATPTPAQQAPASQPASTPQVVYVTVTVTPAPPSDDLANLTTNDLSSLNDTPTPTSTHLPSPTKARSPGFASMLTLSCLACVALVILHRKSR